MPQLTDLLALGQSIWLDFIRRSLLDSGELAALVARGVRGMTSNPAIFEKAIAGSNEYDAEVAALAARGLSDREIYETLAVEDIRRAADVLLPVYRESEGRDGYVSLEVDPFLARDAGATAAEAKRLFERVGRPNLMIKIPATAESLPAVTESLAAGVNVNVTLIFGLKNYREVVQAFFEGLERLAADGPRVGGGHPVGRVASVASFFVSRIDTAVDRELAARGAAGLAGRAAVAWGRLAYAEYRGLFALPRWRALEARGARRQRLLWASTSTKNPAYPPTLYVDELIGPDTVNTVPPETLAAFLAGGRAAPSVARGLEEARGHVARLAELGIDLEAVAARLQQEGVALFEEPFRKLLASIAQKRRGTEGKRA
ncbi:MAG: transaldolase [Desulfobacterales bacterium]